MSWQELPLDRIYFDSVTGVPGITWPIGTPGVPSDVIADVILMCAARKLKVIDVHGALTLGDTMEHYTFIGHRHEAVADTLALAGQDVDESVIIGCLVSGAQGGTGFLTLTNCILYLLTDFQGIANYCDLYGSAMSLKNAGFQDLHHCNSVHSDLTITVNAPTRASFKEMAGNCQFTGQTGGVLYIRGYKGTLIINAMTGGTCDIYANGADITINATCTGGTINIYGNARVTDNSGATVVNDYTKETQLDAIEAVTGALPDAGALNDLATLEARWTAALATALAAYTALRGGYLDQLDFNLQEAIAAIETKLDTPATFMADVSALALEASLGTHDTDIKALLATIAGYLDTEIAAILAAVDTEVAAIITSQGRQLFSMDFWSNPQEEIQVPAVAATLVITPVVNVADLPGGATIVRAIGMFKFRMVENTYDGANALDGASVADTSQVIQVKETTAGAYIDAINFADNQFTFTELGREGGDVFIGQVDVAAQVDADGSYTFQWKMRKADGDFIIFNDIQMGIRIWYSV